MGCYLLMLVLWLAQHLKQLESCLMYWFGVLKIQLLLVSALLLQQGLLQDTVLASPGRPGAALQQLQGLLLDHDSPGWDV